MTIAVIIFCLLMVLLSRKGAEEKNISNRMAYFSGVEASLRHTKESDKQRRHNVTFKEKLYETIRTLGAKLGKIKKNNSLDRKMQQAGWPFLGSEFQVVLLGCGAIGAFVLGLLTMTLVNALLGFVAGCIVCMMVLSISIQRRQKAFVNQLGDMLTMIANALRAGFSFMQALDHIAGEMDDPVKSEVRRVVTDVNVGMPLEEAIHTAGRRRLRAIIMTSLTTIFAMVPLLFTSDMGSELQRPLAIAMIGSMLLGTLVSLFIIPLVYFLLFRTKKTK